MQAEDIESIRSRMPKEKVNYVVEEGKDPYQQESHEFVSFVEVNDDEVLLHRDDMDMIHVEHVESDAEDGAHSNEDIEEDLSYASDSDNDIVM
ncbi:hypothetical protein Pyn_38413 [Prunus yedoensis var. nudiflora]|uniref:Uncharacterized protein n=1 Tax=Prunus yedoensis var. nudiflora TaxID=2094558 RepID=A0A314UQH8_PRUYE|nr:hypothetical protein Pyn_38413 [Prunus yedoensis var. nudiflora]